MGELDPIRAPRKPSFFVTLTVAVAVVLGLIMFMAWWMQSPMPRVLIVLAASAAIGWVAGRLMFKRRRK